jgi:hypothetical protein
MEWSKFFKRGLRGSRQLTREISAIYVLLLCGWGKNRHPNPGTLCAR